MHEARRTEYVRVMLTKEEKNLLKQLAETQKMTVCKYVRKSIFQKKQED